jgi:GDP-mannose 6-dehydrogenase
MNIAIFGLGYVGCVSLGCLANNGHYVIGVDTSKFKVDLINSGKPTIVEKDIDNLIERLTKSGAIKATLDPKTAITESEIALICVGTPSLPTGQLNLNFAYQTAEQIGIGLKEKEAFYTVVVRSTVIPGTNDKIGKIIEQTSGKKRNLHFAVVSNPEFLREGSAVQDFYNPALTIIGTENQTAFEITKKIYNNINAPIFQTDIGVAEMIKYINNAFHALKIAFANEVGVIAKTLGINSDKLMELLILDNKLNISPAYLKPGMAFGGSCLPKDLKGLFTIAHDNYLNTPLLKSIGESNDVHSNRAFEMVERYQSKKVGIIGLAFKKGTDDLRFSPNVELVEKLTGKGYDIKIYDNNIVLSKLLGANKSYIEEKLPHISVMLVNKPEEVINHAQTLVLAHRLDEILMFKEKMKFKNIVDLAGYKELSIYDNYSGIAW